LWIAGAVLALGATGCWPAQGAGPSRQAYNPFESTITPGNVGQLQQAWVATADTLGMRAPIVDDGGVYASTGSSLYGFDAATGARRWKKDAEQQQTVTPEVIRTPVVDGDALLVGEGTGDRGGSYLTYRVDPATGAVVERLAHTGFVDGVRGHLVLTERPGFGAPLFIWQFLDIVDRSDPGPGWSAAVDYTNNGTVATMPTLGSDGAYLAGVGTLLGSPGITRGNGVRRYPLTPPATCPSSPSSGLVCPTWSTPMDGTTATPPVLDDPETTLFSGSDAGTVYAVDTATGAVRWSSAVGSAVTDSPALAGGTLYVPTASGTLLVLDATTGATLWSADTGARIGVQPAVAGGVVFTGSDDGSLRAYPAAGCGSAACPALWSTSTGTDPITGAPAISSGQLYVGAGARLLAYRLP
jgi:outer membrane protein assembly factor BamB